MRAQWRVIGTGIIPGGIALQHNLYQFSCGWGRSDVLAAQNSARRDSSESGTWDFWGLRPFCSFEKNLSLPFRQHLQSFSLYVRICQTLFQILTEEITPHRTKGGGFRTISTFFGRLLCVASKDGAQAQGKNEANRLHTVWQEEGNGNGALCARTPCCRRRMYTAQSSSVLTSIIWSRSLSQFAEISVSTHHLEQLWWSCSPVELFRKSGNLFCQEGLLSKLLQAEVHRGVSTQNWRQEKGCRCCTEFKWRRDTEVAPDWNEVSCTVGLICLRPLSDERGKNRGGRATGGGGPPIRLPLRHPALPVLLCLTLPLPQSLPKSHWSYVFLSWLIVSVSTLSFLEVGISQNWPHWLTTHFMCRENEGRTLVSSGPPAGGRLLGQHAQDAGPDKPNFVWFLLIFMDMVVSIWGDSDQNAPWAVTPTAFVFHVYFGTNVWW